MRLDIQIDGDLNKITAAEYARGERAVTAAIRTAGHNLKANWRAQVAAALGERLGNAVRLDVFPKGQSSLRPAALVYTKAPKVVGAHQGGVTIRAKGRTWMTIPLPAAGRDQGGVRFTPAEWQRRRGIKLRFVPLRGDKAMLVADDAAIRKSGLATQNRRRRRKDGLLTGATTVPIFMLVRQVRLKKRLNLLEQGAAAQAQALGLIIQNWRDNR